MAEEHSRGEGRKAGFCTCLLLLVLLGGSGLWAGGGALPTSEQSHRAGSGLPTDGCERETNFHLAQVLLLQQK